MIEPGQLRVMSPGDFMSAWMQGQVFLVVSNCNEGGQHPDRNNFWSCLIADQLYTFEEKFIEFYSKPVIELGRPEDRTVIS